MDERDRTEPGTVRIDDPWCTAPAPRLWGPAAPEPWAAAARAPMAGAPPGRHGRAAVYGDVWRGADFQRLRRGYRRFTGSACLFFLVWHLLFVTAITVAPGFLGQRLYGAVNVTLLTALGQFASVFLLAWAYSRDARVHRDRAALDLRWEIQERTR